MFSTLKSQVKVPCFQTLIPHHVLPFLQRDE